MTGIAEMVYNPPPTGHVVLLLDNGTTAMTGMQEHPGTGRSLDHHKTGKVVLEDLIKAMGVRNVHIVDATLDPSGYEALVKKSLEKPELSVIINRRACLLAAKSIKEYETCNE
jgi:indolepyruvate ferredoxin oxidoreductase alpha subunit